MAVWRCRVCNYGYDETKGDVSNHIPPRTPFDNLPPEWRCPGCGAAKAFFTLDDDGLLRFR